LFNITPNQENEMTVKFIRKIKNNKIREALHKLFIQAMFKEKTLYEVVDEKLHCSTDGMRFLEPLAISHNYYQYLVEHTVDVPLIIKTKRRLYLALQSKHAKSKRIAECVHIIIQEHEKLISIGYYSVGLLKILSLFHHIDVDKVTFTEIIGIKKLN
jgi:hypothetical protein